MNSVDSSDERSFTVRLRLGRRLGPYAIVSPLGSGGMGEVYAGRDTRLDRIVAIKISKDSFLIDSSAKRAPPPH